MFRVILYIDRWSQVWSSFTIVGQDFVPLLIRMKLVDDMEFESFYDGASYIRHTNALPTGHLGRR
jgi:hypothetical protein